jgi:murein DD-endopeptidase MepM/ murein hydrolase activator NlpD
MHWTTRASGLLLMVLLTGCTHRVSPGAAQPTEPPPAPLSTPSTVPATPGSPGADRPSASATPSPSDLPARARPSSYVFPVAAKSASFGRNHHDYPATDVFAPCGSKAVAVTAGVVAEVSRKDTWTVREDSGASRGGLSVSIVGTDGVRYYGSHLQSVTPNVVAGHRVRAGEVLGLVGHTGSARPTTCHLHFGISPPCAKADWWNRRGVLSPYPYLTSWRDGDQRSPVAAVARWRSAHGCPKAAKGTAK